jgi:hypothetical protein
MSDSGLITAGVFCAMAGAAAAATGIFMLAHQCANGDWHVIEYDVSPYYVAVTCYSTWAGSLQLAGAACMVGAAILTMAFACGPSFEENYNEEGDIEAYPTPAEKNNDEGDIEANPTPAATPVLEPDKAGNHELGY